MSQEGGKYYQISASWALGALLLVTLGSIAALAVIATTSEAGVLSTIALALAVLTFLTELVLSVGQTIAANRRFAQTAELNTQAQIALAEIRQSTGEALARRDQQFERLLQTVVPTALAESLRDSPAAATGLDVDALAEKVVDNALSKFERLTRQDGRAPRAGPHRARIEDLIAQYPDIEARVHLLPASAQIDFWRGVADHVERLQGLTASDTVAELQRMLERLSASS